MKKALCLAVLLTILVLAGCGKKADDTSKQDMETAVTVSADSYYDEEFLNIFKQACVARWDKMGENSEQWNDTQKNDDTDSQKKLCILYNDAELSCVTPFTADHFKDKTFKDEKLKELAIEYAESLYDQYYWSKNANFANYNDSLEYAKISEKKIHVASEIITGYNVEFDRKYKYYYDLVLNYKYMYNEELTTERSTENATEKATETPTTEDASSKESGYKIGQTWVVDGEWELTITGVTESYERNEFSEMSPKAVYIVDYSYKNLGYEDSLQMMNGLYIALDMSAMIVDNGGVMAYSYPGNIDFYPQETPKDATCNAQICIGVDNPGDFTMNVSLFDSMGRTQNAVFNIVVE